MLGHLRRRLTQRSSATPLCPAGGDATRRFLCRSSSTIERHGVRRRFANSTRRARPQTYAYLRSRVLSLESRSSQPTTLVHYGAIHKEIFD